MRKTFARIVSILLVLGLVQDPALVQAAMSARASEVTVPALPLFGSQALQARSVSPAYSVNPLSQSATHWKVLKETGQVALGVLTVAAIVAAHPHGWESIRWWLPDPRSGFGMVYYLWMTTISVFAKRTGWIPGTGMIDIKPTARAFREGDDFEDPRYGKGTVEILESLPNGDWKIHIVFPGKVQRAYIQSILLSTRQLKTTEPQPTSQVRPVELPKPSAKAKAPLDPVSPPTPNRNADRTLISLMKVAELTGARYFTLYQAIQRGYLQPDQIKEENDRNAGRYYFYADRIPQIKAQFPKKINAKKYASASEVASLAGVAEDVVMRAISTGRITADKTVTVGRLRPREFRYIKRTRLPKILPLFRPSPDEKHYMSSSEMEKRIGVKSGALASVQADLTLQRGRRTYRYFRRNRQRVAEIKRAVKTSLKGLLTMKQLAARLRVPASAIARAIKRGKVTADRIFGQGRSRIYLFARSRLAEIRKQLPPDVKKLLSVFQMARLARVDYDRLRNAIEAYEQKRSGELQIKPDLSLERGKAVRHYFSRSRIQEIRRALNPVDPEKYYSLAEVARRLDIGVGVLMGAMKRDELAADKEISRGEATLSYFLRSRLAEIRKLFATDLTDMVVSSELARQLGVAPSTITLAIQNGKLKPDRTVTQGQNTLYYFKKKRVDVIGRQIKPRTLENHYNSAELARLTQVANMTVSAAIRGGLLKPDVVVQRGSGTYYYFAKSLYRAGLEEFFHLGIRDRVTVQGLPRPIGKKRLGQLFQRQSVRFENGDWILQDSGSTMDSRQSPEQHQTFLGAGLALMVSGLMSPIDAARLPLFTFGVLIFAAGIIYNGSRLWSWNKNKPEFGPPLTGPLQTPAATREELPKDTGQVAQGASFELMHDVIAWVWNYAADRNETGEALADPKEENHALAAALEAKLSGMRAAAAHTFRLPDFIWVDIKAAFKDSDPQLYARLRFYGLGFLVSHSEAIFTLRNVFAPAEADRILEVVRQALNRHYGFTADRPGYFSTGEQVWEFVVRHERIHLQFLRNGELLPLEFGRIQRRTVPFVRGIFVDTMIALYGEMPFNQFDNGQSLFEGFLEEFLVQSIQHLERYPNQRSPVALLVEREPLLRPMVPMFEELVHRVYRGVAHHLPALADRDQTDLFRMQISPLDESRVFSAQEINGHLGRLIGRTQQENRPLTIELNLERETSQTERVYVHREVTGQSLRAVTEYITHIAQGRALRVIRLEQQNQANDSQYAYLNSFRIDLVVVDPTQPNITAPEIQGVRPERRETRHHGLRRFLFQAASVRSAKAALAAA